jgi:hypothetical protein
MLEEINEHQYSVLLQSLPVDVFIGKNFSNTPVNVMGEMLEFCMWYGFVRCVVLDLFVYNVTWT